MFVCLGYQNNTLKQSFRSNKLKHYQVDMTIDHRQIHKKNPDHLLSLVIEARLEQVWSCCCWYSTIILITLVSYVYKYAFSFFLLTSSYFLYLCLLVYALIFSLGSDATNSISPKEKSKNCTFIPTPPPTPTFQLAESH